MSTGPARFLNLARCRGGHATVRKPTLEKIDEPHRAIRQSLRPPTRGRTRASQSTRQACGLETSPMWALVVHLFSQSIPDLVQFHAARAQVMRLRLRCVSMSAWIAAGLASGAFAQKTLTWEEAKREFAAANPTLRAGRILVQESRAEEITAYLRPNPDLTVSLDQINPFTGNPYRPFTDTLPFVGGSYLIERRHKRELRRESAQKSTAIAVSEVADQERNLLFDLRNAFVHVLRQKAVQSVARESLGYYDRVLEVSRARFKAGDIA